MSNELTPQEKHPKFYSDPYLFVGKLMVRDNKSIWYEKDTEFDGYLCAKCFDYMDIQDFTPLFKPQEGEQFIKDLEIAVSAGCAPLIESFYLPTKSIVYYTFTTELGDIKVGKRMLSVESPLLFKTAAYVDTLRKLGYYL